MFIQQRTVAHRKVRLHRLNSSTLRLFNRCRPGFQCGVFVIDISGIATPAKGMGIFCSLPPDSAQLFKIVLVMGTAPSAIAAQTEPTVAAVYKSYKIAPGWLQKMLSPYTPPPRHPQVRGPTRRPKSKCIKMRWRINSKLSITASGAQTPASSATDRTSRLRASAADGRRTSRVGCGHLIAPQTVAERLRPPRLQVAVCLPRSRQRLVSVAGRDGAGVFIVGIL